MHRQNQIQNYNSNQSQQQQEQQIQQRISRTQQTVTHHVTQQRGQFRWKKSGKKYMENEKMANFPFVKNVNCAIVHAQKIFLMVCVT